MTSLMTNLFSVFLSQQSQKKIINKSNIATLPAAEMAFCLITNKQQQQKLYPMTLCILFNLNSFSKQKKWRNFNFSLLFLMNSTSTSQNICNLFLF